MTKSIFLVLLLGSVYVQSYSQDLIIKLNGDTIHCKIESFGNTTINYNPTNRPELFISIEKSEIKAYMKDFHWKTITHLPDYISDMATMEVDTQLFLYDYMKTEIEYNQEIGSNLVGAGIWLLVNALANSVFEISYKGQLRDIQDPSNSYSSEEIEKKLDNLDQIHNIQIGINLATLGIAGGNLIAAGVLTMRKNRNKHPKYR